MIKTIEAITYDFFGDVFIDIGANVGMWSTEMVGLYDNIIYVEPGQNALSQGQARIKALCEQKNVPYENIQFLKNVCSSEAGKEFTLTATGPDTGNLSIFAEELYGTTNVTMREEKVPTITLDSLIPNIKEGQEDIFVKIDTEGADLDVMLGGFEFIKKFKPDIFMEAHYHMYFDEAKHKKVFDFMAEQGYKVYEFKMDGYINNPNHVFDGKHNGTQMYDMHLQMVFQYEGEE